MKTLKFVAATAAAWLCATTAPAMAQTYNMGTLAIGSPVYVTHTLTSGNQSDTMFFRINMLGDVGVRLYAIGSAISNLKFSFYEGTVGSGTLLKTFGTTGPNRGVPVTGITSDRYYVVVSSKTQVPRDYGLRLFAEGTPAPAPGPAGLLVFGAGAAAMAARKRRAGGQAAVVGA